MQFVNLFTIIFYKDDKLLSNKIAIKILFTSATFRSIATITGDRAPRRSGSVLHSFLAAAAAADTGLDEPGPCSGGQTAATGSPESLIRTKKTLPFGFICGSNEK